MINHGFVEPVLNQDHHNPFQEGDCKNYGKVMEVSNQVEFLSFRGEEVNAWKGESNWKFNHKRARYFFGWDPFLK